MNPPAPPLAVRFGAIGDLIMATPVLRALSVKYGRPCDVAARGSYPSQVFSGLPFVSSVKAIQRKNIPYWLAPDHWDLVQWLKTRGEGPVYLLEHDGKSRRLLQRAGVKISASCSDIIRWPDEHYVRYLTRVCGFAQEELADPTPTLRVSAEEQTDCNDWLKSLHCLDHPLVLIQAPSRNRNKFKWQKDKKAWPIQKWAEVIRHILRVLPESRVLLCGIRNEQEITFPLAKEIGDTRVLSVAGNANLRRLFALIQVAHSMISVDTGPAHAAAALRCPLVVLFGKTDPRETSPFGHPSLVTIVTGPPGAPELPGDIEWSKYHSMEGISLESVIKAWQNMIAATSPTQLSQRFSD
jgi:ADP-heptose:LPS heptosyltransferase